MAQILTEWSSDDPKLALMLRRIASFPENSADRCELEGFLHMMLARSCWRDADRLRGHRPR